MIFTGGVNGRRCAFRGERPIGPAAETALPHRNVQSRILSATVMILTSIMGRLHVTRPRMEFLARILKLFFAAGVGMTGDSGFQWSERETQSSVFRDGCDDARGAPGCMPGAWCGTDHKFGIALHRRRAGGKSIFRVAIRPIVESKKFRRSIRCNAGAGRRLFTIRRRSKSRGSSGVGRFLSVV